jgi:class 3 adenylate cyclase
MPTPWQFGYALRIIAVALMLAASFPLVAEAESTSTVVPVDLSAAHPVTSVFASATYLDDPGRSYTIDDVSRGKARNAFKPFPPERLHDRLIRGWFRFAVRASASDAGHFSFGADDSCDVFDLYYPRADGTFAVEHGGTLVPFANRGRDVPWPTIPISADIASGKPLYVYLVDNQVPLPNDLELFTVVSTSELAAAYTAQQIHDMFFGGLFFAIIVTNLFLALYLRDRTFLAYVIAMAMHVLVQFTADGTSWTLFWPHAAVPETIAESIIVGVWFISLATFWRTFLDLPKRNPIIDRILLGFMGLTVLRVVLILVLPQPGWLAFADYINAYCLLVTAMVGAIVAMRSGYRPARFLIVAMSGLLFFWGISNPQEWLAELPSGLLGNLMGNGLWYGVAWDALFLTFALADRIETAKRDMIAAQTETVVRLRERDVAVSRFLPRAFLEYLGRSSVVDLQLGDHVESEMTILFSDIRSFTALSENMSPGQTFDFLNSYLRRAGPIIRDHHGFIDKYIGDAIMGLFPNAAHTAIDAAIDMQRGVEEYNRERAAVGDLPIAIGVGLHRGMLMLGAIGESERIETTVIADAVNIAARTESLTKQFHAPVLATDTVIGSLAGSHGYRLRSLGEVIVHGSTRGIEIFEIFDGDAPDVLLDKMRTLDDFTAGIHAFTVGDFISATDAFARVLEQSSKDRTAAYFAAQARRLAEASPAAPWDGRMRLDVK